MIEREKNEARKKPPGKKEETMLKARSFRNGKSMVLFCL